MRFNFLQLQRGGIYTILQISPSSTTNKKNREEQNCKDQRITNGFLSLAISKINHAFQYRQRKGEKRPLKNGKKEIILVYVVHNK